MPSPDALTLPAAAWPPALVPSVLAALLALALAITIWQLYRQRAALRRKVEACRRAEAELIESRERLELTLDVARVGMWEWNMDTGALRWTKEHFRIFGIPQRNGPVEYEEFRCRVHPDDIERVEQAIAQIRQQRGTYAQDFRVVTSEGTRKVYSAGRLLRQDVPSNLMVGLIMDITERENITEALRQSERRLQEMDRRKDEFLATLAHELRNPLAPIQNALEVQRLTRDARTQEQTRCIIERQVAHMVHLVEDLLDINRITQGKVQLRRQTVALNEVIEQAIETCRPQLDAAHHLLSLDLPAGPLPVLADPIRLGQIVANLLHNAIKYTPPGGRIDISVRREDDQIALSVTDNGIGIPPGMLDKVFEMFQQVERRVDWCPGGLGIGLALVHQLVGLHGGSVKAYSEGEGCGARFTVTLPIAPENLPRSVPVATDDTSLPGLRILVVDDNTESAETLALLLQLQGHEVMVAHRGEQALALAMAQPPALMLVDIGLPDMSGHEVGRRLHAAHANIRAAGLSAPPPRPLLVALTGWGHEDDRRASAEAGFDHHLTKPLQMEALRAVIAEAASRQPRLESTQPGRDARMP